MTISEWHVYHYNVIQLQCGSKRDILQSLYDPQKFFRAESLKLRSHVESHLWWTFHLTDSFYCNLCNPFKFDLRCARFSLLSLLKTKSKPQREAQWRSYLKALQRLQVKANLHSQPLSFQNLFSTILDFGGSTICILSDILYKIFMQNLEF